MNSFLIAGIFTLASSVISLALALLITWKSTVSSRWVGWFHALSAGVLLATGLLHLLPESLDHGLSATNMGWAILGTVTFFFLLERTVPWFHHHHNHDAPKGVVSHVLIGNWVHNFTDGFVIAATTLVDVRLGLVTAIAVGIHEIPHEMADFVILFTKLKNKIKAIQYNVLSSIPALVGVLGAVIYQERIEALLGWVLAISGGMFVYIALSDLIPELHEHTHDGFEHAHFFQVLWFMAGIGLIVGMQLVIPMLFPTVQH